MTRAAIYCRVSTDEQAKNGISLQCQKEALTKYANEADYTIVDYYSDEGYSGTSLKRPELQRLLDDVRSKKIDIVLITKLDRWGRGVKNYYKVDEILSENKVHWKTILEDYDTTTSAGKLHINIMLSIAENEAATTAERIKFVFEEKRSKKEVTNGKYSYGFRIENKKYVINKEEQKIFTNFCWDLVKSQAARRTRIEGNEKYGTNFTDSQLIRLFRRPLNIGVYDNGKVHIEDFCPPLIDKELYYQVLEILDRNVKTYFTGKGQTQDYIFSGLIKCAECGSILGGRTSSSNYGLKKSIKHAYTCCKNKKSTQCSNNKHIGEKKLELYLLSNLRKKLNEIKNAVPIKREVEQIENVETIEKNNVIDTTKIRKQIENLLNLYLDGNIPKDIYMKKYNALQAQLEEARKEQKEIKPKQENNIEAINQILNQPLEERYLMMDNKEKRRFWRSIIESITLDKETGITFELKV